MTKVAALYVIADGVYSGRPDVEVWDKNRDARKYAGPWPVVAHPPCQLWTNFARLNFKRWGGEHNRPGNDGGCFGSALAAVRQFGGVLEHPASTWAWPEFRLLRPYQCPGWRQLDRCDRLAEWVCEVWQSAYGHLARKRTWLFYAGATPPFDLDWTRKSGSHQCGKFDRKRSTICGKAASATPPQFAEVLLHLARTANAGVL